MIKLKRGLFSFVIAAALTLHSVPGVGQESIVLGQIAALSSASAKGNATGIILGYQVYLKEINSRGGVHGRKIELALKDDGLNKDRTVALTRELIDVDKAIALVGYLGTAGMTEVTRQKIPSEKDIAFIAPISGLPEIVDTPNVFPLRPGYHDEIDYLVREASQTQRPRIAIAYQNPTFGIKLAKVGEESAKKYGATMLTTVGYEGTPDKPEQLNASLAKAIPEIEKANPDAVVVIGGGGGAIEFIRKLRASSVGAAQIYVLSVIEAPALMKAIGVEQAKGIVISQAVPFPEKGTLPIVREYQAMMKKHAPDQALSFISLEGYMGAKIAIEGLKRAGPNPTRRKVIDALLTLNEFDLGGVSVNYSPKARVGSHDVDLTIITGTGRLTK